MGRKKPIDEFNSNFDNLVFEWDSFGLEDYQMVSFSSSLLALAELPQPQGPWMDISCWDCCPIDSRAGVRAVLVCLRVEMVNC